MAECSFRVFAGFMLLDAELKILIACFGVEELRIAAVRFERYVGEDSAGNDDIAEVDRSAGNGFLLQKGLIFGGKNFNIAPAPAPISQ